MQTISISKSNPLYENFVMPAENIEEMEENVLRQFLSGVSGEEERLKYFRDVISLNLAKLGVKTGVSFGTFVSKETLHAGGYDYTNNKITMDRDYFLHCALVQATLILAHETYHKYYNELCSKHKLLSRDRKDYSTVFNPTILKLLDIKTPELNRTVEEDDRVLYRINNGERRAYSYDGIFTRDFLERANQMASGMNDPEVDKFLQRQNEVADKIISLEDKIMKISEDYFLSKEFLPAFYDKNNQTFNELLSYFIDSQSANQQVLLQTHSGAMSKIASINKAGRVDPNMTILGMSLLLGNLPKAENVERFVDAICASKFDVSKMTLLCASRIAVPILERDFTRLSLCSFNNSNNIPSIFDAEFLDAVNELSWAKNLVLNVGVSNAKSIIEQFRASGDMPNTDFSVIDTYISSLTEKPLLEIGGFKFFNCRDILQYVTAREIEKYPDYDKQTIFRETQAAFSKNLSNVINHFANPDAENKKFISALETFVENPRKMQFEETQERADLGFTFIPEVNEKLAEYIGAVRQSSTQSTDSAYTLLNEDGITYDEAFEQGQREFEQAIANLAKSIQEVADAINGIGPSTFLERIGISSAALVKNNGGEESPYKNSQDETSLTGLKFDESSKPSLDNLQTTQGAGDEGVSEDRPLNIEKSFSTTSRGSNTEAPLSMEDISRMSKGCAYETMGIQMPETSKNNDRQSSQFDEIVYQIQNSRGMQQEQYTMQKGDNDNLQEDTLQPYQRESIDDLESLDDRILSTTQRLLVQEPKNYNLEQTSQAQDYNAEIAKQDILEGLDERILSTTMQLLDTQAPDISPEQ